MSLQLVHIYAENRDWVVREDDSASSLSRHPTLYEAECAAVAYTDAVEDAYVIVHDRYARTHAVRPAALARRPRPS